MKKSTTPTNKLTSSKPIQPIHLDKPFQNNKLISNNTNPVIEVCKHKGQTTTVISKKVDTLKIEEMSHCIENQINKNEKMNTQTNLINLLPPNAKISVLVDMDQFTRIEISNYLDRYRQQHKYDKYQTCNARRKIKAKLFQILIYGYIELKGLNSKNFILNQQQLVNLSEDNVYKKILKYTNEIQKECYQEIKMKQKSMNHRQREHNYSKIMIQLIINLEDYRNFDLRRQILNQTLSPKQLAKKNPYGLYCKQIRQATRQYIRIFLMEHTIEQPETHQQIKDFQFRHKIQQSKQLVSVTQRPVSKTYRKLIQQIQLYTKIDRFKNRIMKSLPQPLNELLRQHLEYAFLR